MYMDLSFLVYFPLSNLKLYLNLVFVKFFYCSNVSAAILGGWPRGTPEHLHQDICKFYLPRANILPEKTTTVPPPGSMIRTDSQIVA